MSPKIVLDVLGLPMFTTTIPSFCMGARNLNSGPHACTPCTLTYSPGPVECFWFFVCFIFDTAGKKVIKRMVTIPMPLFDILLRTDFNLHGYKQPCELRQGRTAECGKSPEISISRVLSSPPSRCLNQSCGIVVAGGSNAMLCVS